MNTSLQELKGELDAMIRSGASGRKPIWRSGSVLPETAIDRGEFTLQDSSNTVVIAERRPDPLLEEQRRNAAEAIQQNENKRRSEEADARHTLEMQPLYEQVEIAKATTQIATRHMMDRVDNEKRAQEQALAEEQAQRNHQRHLETIELNARLEREATTSRQSHPRTKPVGSRSPSSSTRLS